MSKEIIFYAYQQGTSGMPGKAKVTKCHNLKQAHELFNEERQMVQDGESIHDYFDITIDGKLLRSFTK